MPLLRLQRQGRDRPGVETLQRDRFARLLAIAVGTLGEALQCGIDLGDQLALAIPGAKLDGAIGLRRGPVRDIRVILVFGLQGDQSLLRLRQNVFLPDEQLVGEEVGVRREF